MSKEPKILIVDDIEEYLKSLKAILENKFSVITSTSLEDARNKVSNDIEIILLDIRLDENDDANKDGLLLLEWIKKKYPEIPVVMMSGYKEFDLAVDSLNLGASYFLRKPINSSELNVILKTIMEKSVLFRENVELKEKLKKFKT
jgi:Response regulator containing CheY-like receiver, AAA-type ATPase, and DNA-binding domains